jgi:hypothetical protein
MHIVVTPKFYANIILLVTMEIVINSIDYILIELDSKGLPFRIFPNNISSI